MFKVLLKKQLSEVFRSYFYDAKKNKMRSKGAIIGYFIFFVVIMVGLLGGMFTMLSLSLCEPLTATGTGWLYFFLIGCMAILLGAFGSVFNTYSGLYLAKDNDLLLSMPIPVRTIMASRLCNVYFMGAMYSVMVFLPALVIYWIVTGPTVSKVICGILMFLIITVIVLLLSCVLGWVVAKISLRLKNKSFTTVLLSLVFIGLYYFFYFKASIFIQNLIQNAETYGNKIKGAAYGLYLFGRIGEGDWLATVIFTAAVAVLSVLIWTLMQRSFIKIATATGKTQKVHYTEKMAKVKSPFRALLSKEFGRFTSSANYMLNCGFGILVIPLAAVGLLILGGDIVEAIGILLAARPGSISILICLILCTLSVMNDMAAPSVSLEGKSIWIPQSLPVSGKMILRAKACVQLILTGVPMLLAILSAMAVLNASPVEKLLVCLTVFLYIGFQAFFNLFVGIKMPLLTWTNEIVPIKQGGAVAIALFGNWAILAVFCAGYFFIGYVIGAGLYLLLWSILFGGFGFYLMHWLDTKGAEVFAAL